MIVNPEYVGEKSGIKYGLTTDNIIRPKVKDKA